jgi:prepilin peptidase CpaA
VEHSFFPKKQDVFYAMNLLVLLLWLAVCADQDARSRKVSNVLTFGAAFIALMYLLFYKTTWLCAPMSEGWTALLIAIALTLPGYALGKLGAGDVKLLIALGLATDSLYLLGTFVGAGVFSVIWLMARQKIWRYAGQGLTNRYVCMHPDSSEKQPFVPFLFIGFAGTCALTTYSNGHLSLCT